MTLKLAATLALAATLGWTAPTLAAGSKEAGQAKAAVCAGCHGPDGNSLSPEWPNLASQNQAYIVRQLKAFHAGERQNPLMSPMAAMLTEQDMADVAAYFSSQTVRGGEADPALVKLGQRVYRSGNIDGKVMACAGCHGPQGHGNAPAGWPNIQGQHATYVAAQLRAYKAGTRTTDPNQIMRTMASMLSEEEIDAVASYVQGLR
ncbi:MAG: c-type cytochrome [Steroidobacteraceae bacterium]